MNIEEIRSLFEYKNGEVINKVSRGSVRKGARAGYETPDGYLRVSVNKKYYYVHKISYLLNTGEDPEGFVVDHINGVRSDNRFENLRKADKRLNQYNKASQAGTSSVYKGVWYDSVKKVWKASFRTPEKRVYLGQFHSEESAALAYDKMAETYHGAFAKFNLPASFRE